MLNRTFLTGMPLLITCACSGASGVVTPIATGGASSTPSSGSVISNGGSSTTSVAAGGTSANTGGVVGLGGTGTGALVNTGGILTGGNASTGGNAPNGGKSSAGGTNSTGGVTAVAGKSGTGGNAADGGKTSTGGAPVTGGNSSTGGRSSTGGAPATGGKSSTGGAPAAGGNSSTGGSSSASTSSGGCSRAMLQSAVDSYLAAIKVGSAASLPSGLSYKENNTTVALTAGLWATPLTVDLLPPLTLLDVDKCQSYSEVIVNNNHKYILGARLTVTASTGQLSAINVLMTDCPTAWLFNADAYLRYSKQEQDAGGWGPVAPADQLTRQALMDAGTAYFAYWSDTTVSVPWGYPCSRLEGGAETNPTGDKNTTCSVGIPANTAVRVTEQLVDVDYGMVVDFLGLPGPDSHWFRVNKDGIRYIHTLTSCMLNGSWQCPSAQPTCTS